MKKYRTVGVTFEVKDQLTQIWFPFDCLVSPSALTTIDRVRAWVLDRIPTADDCKLSKIVYC